LEAKFPLYYQDTQSSENESTRQFILPMYLSSSEDLGDITISVEDSSGDQTFSWKISEFNSEVQDSIIINKPEMYLLTISRVNGPTVDPEDDSPISIQANLTVNISYMGDENKFGTLFVLYPKVIKGINGNLSAYTDLNNVLNRIKYLVQHSSDPNTKIYYINEPENELAIENDNIINL
jgi:hypothetical protein